MNLKILHLKVLAFAVAATSWSLAANAEMHLYWHWEGGGGGSCGPFCTDVIAAHIVIDGWRDDGTGPNDVSVRFPQKGARGSKMLTSDHGQIDVSSKPAFGCTVAKNMPGIKGFAPGKKTWSVYIDPSVDSDLQAAFKGVIDDVNHDQQQIRGSDFTIKLVSLQLLADSYVTTPGWFTKEIPSDLTARSYVTTDRAGWIKDSWAEVKPGPLVYPQDARNLAAHLLGQLAGLNDVKPDSSSFYDSVMNPMSARRSMDICTMAAIDANINAGKNK